MSRDDSKKWILERRARLLVAAAASAGIALAVQACEKKDDGPPPGPCLSMPQPVDEDAGPPPEPCLSPPPPEVCLSPQICLEVAPPDDPPKKDGPFAEPPPGKS